MLTIKEQLQAAIQHYRVSKKAMARLAGVSDCMIYGILNGKQTAIWEDSYARLKPWLDLEAAVDPSLLKKGKRLSVDILLD